MPTKIWKSDEVKKLYRQPLLKLIHKAHRIHLKHFKSNEVELCTLLSIKTGACPEDCAYCPQSAHYKTDTMIEKLYDVKTVIERATLAKKNGATRFCMGAAWRNPPAKQFPKVLEMIKAVKALGLETCVTLGMLSSDQSNALKTAGLDFYNHNIDTSEDYYKKIISTRTFQDRVETLDKVRDADIKLCCGGIIGMGESHEDRIQFLLTLANLPKPPESVPINRLIPIKGTPLSNAEQIDNFEYIKIIALARIMMPTARVRISAGRESMSEEMQTLCFMAGANSIFLGEKLLVTPNPTYDQDLLFLNKIGIKPLTSHLS